MDSKSTEELRHEIKAASDIEDYIILRGCIRILKGRFENQIINEYEE